MSFKNPLKTIQKSKHSKIIKKFHLKILKFHFKFSEKDLKILLTLF